MAEEVKLFKTWSSPFGSRVVWALKLKGIQYEFVDEDLSNKSSLLLQYNPVHKKVPVLLHNGKPIVESLVILEYIEDTWKQSPLLPDDPHLRSQARFWAKFSEDKVNSNVSFPSTNSGLYCLHFCTWQAFMKDGMEQEEALDAVRSNLGILEAELIRKGKTFFGGDEIGLADIALGWMTNLVPVFEEIVQVKLMDEQQFPVLCSWAKEFSVAPVVKENLPPHDKMVAKFRAIRDARA